LFVFGTHLSLCFRSPSTLLVSTIDGNVHAIDLDSGRTKWTLEVCVFPSPVSVFTAARSGVLQTGRPLLGSSHLQRANGTDEQQQHVHQQLIIPEVSGSLFFSTGDPQRPPIEVMRCYVPLCCAGCRPARVYCR
jgi:outer membrane protein assembly factor BamB